jgi:hypothetical protein
MNIMLKDGSHINREIYQHLCDTVEDLANIPSNQINFGSLAYIVSTGELYIADSNRQWKVV